MNGNRSLSFLLPKSDVNAHAFDIVEEESTLSYAGHTYRIKSVEERIVGVTPVKIIVAPHTFFDIVDEYRYDTLTNGFKSISQVLSFIFTGTSRNFSVIDSFETVEFENFGAANCLDLFSKVIDRYGAEYDLDGNTVILRKRIGDTIDLQFRYNHNIKTFKKSLDTSNLSTYIRGTGKQNDDGTYVVEAEYTSPNASIFGIRHAQPYSNESITHRETLIRNLQAKIIDSPEVSIELEFVVLADAGYTKPKPSLGDTVPTIYEPLNDLNLDLRVMEIEEYPESNKAPKVTLATVRKSLAKATFSYQKALLDKIYDENSGRLRYDVYDEAVKRATEALNNSLTELEYPVGMGIVARDPSNPNRFTAFRSVGLGVTTDGGITFPNAITPDGVNTALLTAGQIKTNNIQIIGNDDLFYWDGNYLIAIDANDAAKYVRLNSDGLYIAKGGLIIEGSDGRRWVENGVYRNNLAVQQTSPPFIGDNVTTVNRYYRTSVQTYETIGAYAANHEGRYLKVEGYGLVGDGDLGVAVESYAGDVSFYQVLTVMHDPNSTEGKYFELIVDLGVPTYAKMQFYIKMRSIDVSEEVGCRINRVIQYG